MLGHLTEFVDSGPTNLVVSQILFPAENDGFLPLNISALIANFWIRINAMCEIARRANFKTFMRNSILGATNSNQNRHEKFPKEVTSYRKGLDFLLFPSINKVSRFELIAMI